jgi:hypothetical protein
MDPDSEGIYLTVMTSQGPQVKFIDKTVWEKPPPALPSIDRMFVDRYEDLLQASPPSPTPLTFEVSDYKASKYLWPQYWIPFIWSSPEGGVEVQVLTSGFDPLKKHTYSAMVAWNTYLESADWSLNYLNSVTPLPTQLSASQSHSYLVTKENLI